MTTPGIDAERPYTHDMVIVHRMFRRESGLLPRMVRAVPEGDTARARAIADHYEFYAAGLHSHHTGEDELVWPLLLARVDLEAETVLRMEAQHHRVDETMQRVAALLPAWRSSASAAAREQIAVALQEHHAALIEHLDDEEQYVLRLIAEHLTVAEWQAVGERGMKHVQEDRKHALIALGSILEEADAQETAFFMSHLPAPARVLWHLVGKRQYRRRTQLLRAGL